MVGWLLARLGRAVVAAWAIASLVFISSRLLPGGPEQTLLADASDYSRPTTVVRSGASQQATRQAVRERLGLGLPVFYFTRSASPTPAWHWHGTANQYHRWARGLLHGNLGYSYRDGQPVVALLRQALIYSLPLALTAAALGGALALGLGLYLAGAPGGWVQQATLALLSGLQVTPLFLLALALLLAFANPDFLDLLPAAGQAPPAATGGQLVGYWLARSALPLLSLVLSILPVLTLPLAAALRYEARAGYATTARAKGLSALRVLRRHALPNALLPLLTILTDLLPALLAGTVVIEVLFALPGSGRLLAEAAAAHDYPVVVAGVLFAAAARLLSLLLADVLYFVVDPRLRPAA